MSAATHVTRAAEAEGIVDFPRRLEESRALLRRRKDLKETVARYQHAIEREAEPTDESTVVAALERCRTALAKVPAERLARTCRPYRSIAGGLEASMLPEVIAQFLSSARARAQAEGQNRSKRAKKAREKLPALEAQLREMEGI